MISFLILQLYSSIFERDIFSAVFNVIMFDFRMKFKNMVLREIFGG